MASVYIEKTFTLPYPGKDCIVLVIYGVDDGNGAPKVEIPHYTSYCFVAKYINDSGLVGDWTGGDMSGVVSMEVSNDTATIVTQIPFGNNKSRCCLIPIENGW